MIDFIAFLVFVVIIGVSSVGAVIIYNHVKSKKSCEVEYNVNHCERNLTYTPTYPEVTND